MQTSALTHMVRRGALFLAIALAASLWLAPITSAQGRMGDPEQMKERMAARTDTLVKRLNLTAAQDEPVRAILTAHNDKQMELRNKARESGSFMGMREDMAKLNEETAMKLGEVLTEEQMAAYNKFMEEQRGRRGGRRGGPRGGF